MPQQRMSAVIVSGGKQYRVAPGDRILVDRLQVEPGAEVKLEHVLLLDDGDEVQVGRPLVEGASLAARVLGHERGPKIEVLRYKSKKRVRVHRGARADLTALEILDPSAGRSRAKTAKIEKTEKTEAKPRKRAAKPKVEEPSAEEETES
ncbi:MAG TPA: 50S ribosomal protein L21 [Candidatus Dormibacteraeota bacterium]